MTWTDGCEGQCNPIHSVSERGLEGLSRFVRFRAGKFDQIRFSSEFSEYRNTVYWCFKGLIC